MSLSKILIFLLCLTTKAWADSKYYNDFDKKITNLSKEKGYDVKITHAPPIDFPAHYDMKKVVVYGDLLENDWQQIVNEDTKSKQEAQGLTNLIGSLKQQNLLTESEFKKLLAKLNKTYTEIHNKFSGENDKYIEYNKRLSKKYSTLEFADYLNNLKLASNCKLKVAITGVPDILFLTVTEERDGKSFTLEAKLHLNKSVPATSYDPAHRRLETNFTHLDFGGTTDQIDLHVLHYTDGGVELFSIQNIHKKDYLIKVPIVGLKLFEHVGSPYINCSDADISSSSKISVDGNRNQKKVDRDMSESTNGSANAVTK